MSNGRRETMGVKSTERLTHDEAIDMAIDLYAKANRRKIGAQFYAMDIADLENELERLSDEAAGGEGFRNFSISNY